MAKDLLKVKDLSIQYNTDDGVVKAVDHMTFEIGIGETIGIVGETGAGKTTTALGIMRLVPAPPGKIVQGEILFKGEDLLKKKEEEMRNIRGNKISMIFQDPMTSLNPVMTTEDQVAEVILLHQKANQKEALEKARDMIETVGIPRERGKEYPHQFSGGMRQRIVIAIALACNPELLIADEPTTALDVTIQAQVLKLMKRLKDEFETSMIMITHDLGVVANICDKVAIMYTGYVVEYAKVSDLFERPLHPYTEGLFGSIPNVEEDEKRLKPIKGLMPDPTEIPEGCPFNPRCPKAMDICRKVLPDRAEVKEGHFVNCHLYPAEQYRK
ncbi:ABC transporter ATP-binding protein [Tindallia californiensis]|uniref:Peptide/nickel transport system ATP-binding protein n=1 Tax=Tindallia californiensis TaxID=159292 RepID=A0A1H3QST7_9FIRM|nr:ABC transporter ATP-binding protein [Tindallia californiensis]SDZ16584.1 peptide/nickel transport system ATP-binding protein [Tindallia californiensis]